MAGLHSKDDGRLDKGLAAILTVSHQPINSGRKLQFKPGLLRRLTHADWPGNVRQPQNEIKRLTAFASGAVIGKEDLSDEMPPARASGRRYRLRAVPFRSRRLWKIWSAK